MAGRSIASTPEHEALNTELFDVILRHRHIPAEELLAIASNIVGKLIAMQDQHKYTTDQIIRLVEENMALGNASIMATLQNTKGSA